MLRDTTLTTVRFRVVNRSWNWFMHAPVDVLYRSLAAILEWLTSPCDVELYAVEGEDVYDSMGVRRDCCPGLEPTLEDRDPSDPLIGTWPQIIVCREPSARRNLRGEA